MGNLLRLTGASLAIAAMALIVTVEPVGATQPPIPPTSMPGPGMGLIAIVAIIGGLVIAKLWRGK